MALKPASKKYAGVYINNLKNGDVAYYINFRDEFGNPVKKKVGTKTKQSNFTVKDAYDKLIEVKHQLTTGNEVSLKPSRKKKVTFEEVYKEYIEFIKNSKKSWKDDQNIYDNHLAIFAKRDIRSLKLKEFALLQQQKVKEISKKTKKPLSAKSINNIFAVARQIINYAIKYELVQNYTNPISDGKLKFLKVDNQRINYFTKDQLNKLLNVLLKYPNPNLYNLTVLLVYTGARFSEVASLKWADINFETEMIYFKSTKEGNPRWIVMNDLVKEVIYSLKEESNSYLIMTNDKGTQYTEMPPKWQHFVDELIVGNKNAERKYRLTPHSLRHTHASWLAMAGLDILAIKDQLGHKSLTMTHRYSHLCDSQRHNAVKAMLD
jgi:integrase